MKKVFVVTGYQLGWDCVVGVYDSETNSFEELVKEFPEQDYYIQEQFVYSKA